MESYVAYYTILNVRLDSCFSAAARTLPIAQHHQLQED